MKKMYLIFAALGMFMFANVEAATLSWGTFDPAFTSTKLTDSTDPYLIRASAQVGDEESITGSWNFTINTLGTAVTKIVVGLSPNFAGSVSDLSFNGGVFSDWIENPIGQFIWTGWATSVNPIVLSVTGEIEDHMDITVYGVNAPIPAAIWLFGSALMGLFGVSRRKSAALSA